METLSQRPFLARNEFLVRRLHSLTGLIPVGAYMVVHLTTNLTVWDKVGGPGMFQRAVYQIHSLGGLLPFVEWAFIFLPILFHAGLGVMIVCEGSLNQGSYPLPGNVRFTLQRVTGVIAFVFIVLHVFHLHGWFHFEGWLEGVAKPLGGAKFSPHHAASTLGMAMQGILVPVLYAIGLAACVFHLANGIWTMGITWGAWTSPAAQTRAGMVCAALGAGLTILAVGAFVGAISVDVDAAATIEDKMYESRVSSGEIPEHDGEGSHEPKPPSVSAIEAASVDR